MKMLTFVPEKKRPQCLSILGEMEEDTVVYRINEKGDVHFHIFLKNDTIPDLTRLTGKVIIHDIEESYIEAIRREHHSFKEFPISRQQGGNFSTSIWSQPSDGDAKTIRKPSSSNELTISTKQEAEAGSFGSSNE